MKTLKLLLLTLISFFTLSTQAQLPDGSIAPDFTLTDVNGTTHNLYTYLDSGYTVFIDLFAVWCGPCWNYKQAGTLDDLYEQHGPTGYPNVLPNTTNDVMVISVEGDENPLSCMYGTGCNTYGDWITGNPFPVICTDGTVNNDQITSDYQLSYWPTIYMICPDRLTTEVGQSSSPYSYISSCSPPASNIYDAKALNSNGETETCDGTLIPEITFQNYGLTNLTSLDIEVYKNGTLESTTPWTGNLTTYQIDNVILPTLTNVGSDLIEIKTINPNGQLDDDLSNNDISFYSTLATQNVNINITIEITTDRYASETTWNIKNSSGVVISNGGPWQDLSANGQTIQTPVNVTLDPLECYTFTIEDTYGDGICCNYGNGSFTVTDANNTVLALGGGFADSESAMFKTETITVGIEEINKIQIDNRMFDILGRELTEIPIGVMYIQNKKLKIIK